MFRPAHWTDRKPEVNFQITASTCSECSDAVPRTQLKDEGPCLESGAVPALHLLSRVDLCIPRQHYGAQLLWYPTALPQPTVVCFDLLAEKPKEMEEAVLSWQKPNFSDYLFLNKTHHAFVTQLSEQWWLTWTAVTLLLTTKNCRRNSAAQQLDVYKHPKEEED